MKSIDTDYEYIVLEGSSYEVGKMRGETLKNYPGDTKYYYNLFKDSDIPLSNEKIKYIRKVYDEYCPGLNDEIEGFAEAFGVKSDNIVLNTNLFESNYGCCQIVALPCITKNGHVLVGRSYEYTPDDEKKLSICRINGKPAHLGFAVFLFGRYEGVNEHGLSITVSAAAPGVETSVNGVRFWVAIRSIIENCTNTEDAVYMLKNMPISSNSNFIIADKQGMAVLCEVSCFNGKKEVKVKKAEDYLVSTNHYTIEGMKKYNIAKMNQSVMRYNAAHDTMNKSTPSVSKDTLKKILSNKLPHGVCCHYYEDGLGTLYSMIFDLTTLDIHVCFGSPNINGWKKYDMFNEKKGSTNIKIPYVNEYPTAFSNFWAKCD